MKPVLSAKHSTEYRFRLSSGYVIRYINNLLIVYKAGREEAVRGQSLYRTTPFQYSIQVLFREKQIANITNNLKRNISIIHLIRNYILLKFYKYSVNVDTLTRSTETNYAYSDFPLPLCTVYS